MSTETTTQLELIDDKPDEVKSDLRKFNKAEQAVNLVITELSGIKEVMDQAGVDHAMEVMKKAKTVENTIEKKRKDLVEPYNAEVKRINGYAKDLMRKIPPAIDGVKTVLLTYQKNEEKKAKDKRTAERKVQLSDFGFVLDGDMWVHADQCIKSVVWQNVLADTDPTQWTFIIEGITKDLESAKQAATAALQQQKEGAAFFGDTEETAAIDQQISQLQTTPTPAATSSYSSFSAGKVRGLTKRWTFEITDISQVPREFLQVDEKKVKEAITAGTRSIPGVRIYQDESITLR